MNLVVTMAGASQRFYDEGYLQPKWSLPIGKGGTVMSRAIESVDPLLARDDLLVVVCLEGDEVRARECMASSSLKDRIMWFTLPEILDGQALTAARAVEGLNLQTQQLVVWNVDTVLKGLQPRGFPRDKNWLCVTELLGDRWSFALVGADGCVIRTAEKERISDLASVGLYSFESGALFLDALDDTNEVSGRTIESYVAPVYNALIRRGDSVLAVAIDQTQVLDLGTPSAYQTYIESNPGSVG